MKTFYPTAKVTKNSKRLLLILVMLGSLISTTGHPLLEEPMTKQSIIPFYAAAPACDPLRFSSVSPGMWRCFKDAVSLQMHVTFQRADSGQVSLEGSKVDYSFDPNHQLLTFIATSNWLRLVTCAQINQRISEYLADCRGPKIKRLQNDTNIEKWRIDEPNIKQADTSYPQIKLRPRDRVRVDAAGCVQTGGRRDTWRLYVDPRGPNSDHLYHGLIKLPGMPNSIRIREFVTKGNNYEVPPNSRGDMTLHLGYEDERDDYANNGYWGRDRGVDGQCVNIEKAWVEVTIYHPGSF